MFRRDVSFIPRSAVVFLAVAALFSSFSASAQEPVTATLEKTSAFKVDPSDSEVHENSDNSSHKDIKEMEFTVEPAKGETGVVFLSSGGKRYRVDTVSKTVEEIDPVATDSFGKAQGPDSAFRATISESKNLPRDAQNSDDEEESEYFFEPGDEPYDYRLINVPTPKSVPKGTWNLSFSHRFRQPIHPISESGKTLLGFDSFSVSAFSVTYGITEKLYVTAGRSPICQRGLCRTIEIGAGYHVLDQVEESPVALTVYGSVEGDRNFSKDFTMNLQTMVSRRLGKRVYLFFSPAVHLNANGNRRFDPRPEDFFPSEPLANEFSLPKHAASFGFGTAVMVTPSLLGVFEFIPRVGFKLGRVNAVFDESFNIVGFENQSEPSIGFGVQKNIGNHSFSLTFSNTQTTTTSRNNSSNLLFSPKRLIIGFNLFRRL